MAIRTISGKTAVITGATSGIGLETARAFLREGANVVVAGRRQERLDEFVAEGGAKALGVQTDVAVAEQCDELIAKAKERFGSIDILVNNAGAGMSTKFEEQSLEEFRKLMDVNFWGAVHCCMAAVPVMRSQAQGGVIINVSSILGKRGMPFETAYCATKFALAGFSEALRTELSTGGIDVSTVFPGFVETEFFGSMQNDVGMALPPFVRGFPAEGLAAAIVQDARFPQPEIVMSLDAQFINFVNTVAPWAMDAVLSFGAPFMQSGRSTS
ncbi:MAG: SDR family NAD(P)-dependent oxidoreductase [Tepidiformaceae bacterium]